MLHHGSLAAEPAVIVSFRMRTKQCRSVGNLRLLTPRVSALVWPLTCVYAAVTGQTGGVRELLATSCEHAAMWLLTSVCPDVNIEGTALDEGLLAISHVALEWSSFRVDSEVSLQVGFPVEGFATRFSPFVPAAGPGTRG